MGVRRNFCREDKVDIVFIFFKLLSADDRVARCVL